MRTTDRDCFPHSPQHDGDGDDDGDGDGHDHNLVTYLMIKINGNLDPPRLSLIFALIKSSPYCS